MRNRFSKMSISGCYHRLLTVEKVAGHNKAKLGNSSEQINHDKPLAYHLIRNLRTYDKKSSNLERCRESYNKPRDGMKILKDQDLLISANACPELKAFLNTILWLSDGELIR